jgi:hypothetical protein
VVAYTAATHKKEVRIIGNKKTIIAVLISLLLLFPVGLLLSCLGPGSSSRPRQLPKAISFQNTVSVASDGCCFLVSNIEITLNDSQRNYNVLQKDAVYQRERFDETLPAEIANTDIEVWITFDYSYSERGTETIAILPAMPILELREHGVMVYFQERGGMFMLVICGKTTSLFYLSGEDGWIAVDLDFPYYTLSGL